MLQGGEHVARRGKKLDDELREQIKAHYASCGNLNETARKFRASWSTVKKIVAANPDSFHKLREQKKHEHIEKSWSVIHAYIDRLHDPELIQKTNARDSAIVAGTLWDKLNREKELAYKGQEIELKRRELEQKNKAPETPNVKIYLNALKGEYQDSFIYNC
ncbi:hypothetical protein SAMN04487866_101162 [Thermoactinomyces sp. DSM 45891]|uniref:hypothetical protein n=1 Tax=Thermoactinomyces sp. DSM 45891 TaxID=1761907 RepID=UPI0009181463|nr:hypothetical protein [Thermoactinomyces sp. DSM 45891]SFX00589.1 hypothetical protein SAMN04487866_101162 [Thermoactinomyces sp. DSM 45891]